MPTSAKPLWVLTGLLLGCFPALNFFYWPQVLNSGVLPPDGDSIGIPILGSILLTIIASPIILGVSWFCLRLYNPETRLATIRWDRPIRTIAATIIFGGAAVLCILSAIFDLERAWPWYEYIWTGYALAWVPWLLGVRAALIDQDSRANRLDFWSNKTP